MMSPVKFSSRSWNSNCSQLTKVTTGENIQDNDPETKVLGLRWNAKDDVLKLQKENNPIQLKGQ